MTDRPIIFSGPMVRALLEGRKSMTRRVLKEQRHVAHPIFCGGRWQWHGTSGAVLGDVVMPYAPGDRLWVRETFTCEGQSDGECLYRSTVADDTGYYLEEIAEIRWRSPIHMPRWASRLTLLVTEVRVQRLQEISEEEAKAEGSPVCGPLGSNGAFPFSEMSHRHGFHAIWNGIHGADAWDANPWVAAVTFTVHRCDIDAFAQEKADD